VRELQALIERYFPCSFERGGPLLVVLGVLSTLFFVFTQMGFHEEFRDQPEHLMVLTFLISAWSQRHRLKSDLVIRLLILAGVIPWLLFAVNALIDYETAVKYRSANELLNLFLFLPLAWWMGGSAEGARRMLIIAFLGLITAIVFDPDLEASLRRMFAGQRIDFDILDIQNAQHGAMFFGLVVLYCICALSHRKPTEALLSWRNALILLTGLAGLAGVAGTQSLYRAFRLRTRRAGQESDDDEATRHEHLHHDSKYCRFTAGCRCALLGIDRNSAKARDRGPYNRRVTDYGQPGGDPYKGFRDSRALLGRGTQMDSRKTDHGLGSGSAQGRHSNGGALSGRHQNQLRPSAQRLPEHPARFRCGRFYLYRHL
jgi:hypothetical protein